jgi:hypothetical protein
MLHSLNRVLERRVGYFGYPDFDVGLTLPHQHNTCI